MSRFIQKIKKDKFSTSVAILSAGVGNRIKSYEPRSLLKIGGETLLDHQIKLVNNAFEDPEIIVALGYAANKVIKKTKSSLRVVENQLYSSTGSLESLRLSVNNCTGDGILFFHGDLYFNPKTINSLDYSRSFIIVDSKNQIADREVGVTYVNGWATILSYGLQTKWGQIAFITGKELAILKSICLKNDESLKQKLTFEVINMILTKGGKFKCYEPMDMSIIEIDCMKDLQNENFNI
jgi:choline kinase